MLFFNISPGSRPILSDDDKQAVLVKLRRAYAWGRVRVPVGVRTLLGALFIAGGVLGFLPILGFWMIPLGLVLISLDIPPFRRRVQSWLHRKTRNANRNGGGKGQGQSGDRN